MVVLTPDGTSVLTPDGLLVLTPDGSGAGLPAVFSTPRRDLLWVHDLSGAQVGVIGRDFRELYTDTILDQSEKLVFEIPASHPKAYLLDLEVRLRLQSRTYRVRELTHERRGAEVVIRVEAPAVWARLGENDHIGSLVIDQLNPAAGGQLILAQTSWSVGADSVHTGAFSMESQDRSFLANIRTWAKITGTVVTFDTQAQTVSWLQVRGTDVGLAFRHGRNLRNVVRRRTPPQVTSLFPYGRDDLTIAGVNGGLAYVEDLSYYTALGLSEDDARDFYGKRRVIRDQSFVKEADLLAWAQSKIVDEAQSIQSVELDVVDISELTGVTEELQVGDRCRAFDPDFGEEFTATVTRYVDHRLQPWRNEIELSTSPQIVADPDTSAGRPQQSNEWILFSGPVSANFKIRNDGIFTVARIPLRFRDGGRAHYHLDLWLTGVGAGTAVVTVFENEESETIREPLTVAYTDAGRVRVHLTWAAEELVGRRDYRIRVTTQATGGAGSAKGVDLDIEDDATASFYILAQGAVQESPVEANSVTFDYTGAVQQWTVPDNVTGPITIEANGAAGGDFNDPGGNGGQVIASFATVVPGDVYDVYVGGTTINSLAGWPNGGAGGGAFSGSAGRGGGGSTFVTPAGQGIAGALLVAPAGGGSSVDHPGGAGGLFLGEDGADGLAEGGAGATQAGGGAGGTGAGNGSAGTSGAGGAGATGSGSLGNGGGGGGGGIFGGGGGGSTDAVNGDGPGAGGGGVGGISTSAYNVIVNDGAVSGHGQVTISWETPS